MSSAEIAIGTTLALLLQDKDNQDLLKLKDPSLLEQLTKSGLIDGERDIKVVLKSNKKDALVFVRSIENALRHLLPEDEGANAEIGTKNNLLLMDARRSYCAYRKGTLAPSAPSASAQPNKLSGVNFPSERDLNWNSVQRVVRYIPIFVIFVLLQWMGVNGEELAKINKWAPLVSVAVVALVVYAAAIEAIWVLLAFSYNYLRGEDKSMLGALKEVVVQRFSGESSPRGRHGA